MYCVLIKDKHQSLKRLDANIALFMLSIILIVNVTTSQEVLNLREIPRSLQTGKLCSSLSNISPDGNTTCKKIEKKNIAEKS